MTIADLARFVAAEQEFDMQWRLVVEFLKEYHQESAGVRLGLLKDAPRPTGDERWDALFAGLAEHLAMRDGKAAPRWSASGGLRRFWFPFDAPGARAQALVHARAVPLGMLMPCSSRTASYLRKHRPWAPNWACPAGG
jgi:hypothetical protein